MNGAQGSVFFIKTEDGSQAVLKNVSALYYLWKIFYNQVDAFDSSTRKTWNHSAVRSLYLKNWETKGTASLVSFTKPNYVQ